MNERRLNGEERSPRQWHQADHRRGQARLSLGELEGMEVKFQPKLAPDQQRLLAALGVKVVFSDDGFDPTVRDTHASRHRD